MNAIDILTHGHETAMSAVRSLGPEAWTRPGALGTWSAKDLVGHLGAFEVRFAEALGPFVGHVPATNLLAADTATFNDDQAAIRTDWSVDAVLEEFTTAYDLVMELARAVPEGRWAEVGTSPWYGTAYALDDLVVYQMYGHKREHVPQIEAAAERG
jgi:hypothetical protein